MGQKLQICLLLILLSLLLPCHSLDVCTDCRNNNPIWIVKHDRTEPNWGNSYFYTIDPETTRMHLEITPREGEGWKKIKVEELEITSKMDVFVHGVAAYGRPSKKKALKKEPFDIIFKCKAHGISNIKVTIPINDDEKQNPSGQVVFYFRKNCGDGGPREGFNVASDVKMVGFADANDTGLVVIDSQPLHEWKKGTNVISTDKASMDFFFWISPKKGSVIYNVYSTSDKEWLIATPTGDAVNNFLDPKIPFQKLTMVFKCVKRLLPMEGTTNTIPEAKVQITIDVLGFDPIVIPFIKQCPLTRNPQHYVNVYGDDGEEIVVKGMLISSFDPLHRENNPVYEKRSKEFCVRLDRISKEFHFPVTATSSDPLIVDIKATGELRESGYMTQDASCIKIRHFCRDLGAADITVSLPLTHSETIHWGYKQQCKALHRARVVPMLTANQVMFLICLFIIVISVIVFFNWEAIERQLSEVWPSRRKIRQNRQQQHERETQNLPDPEAQVN